MSGESTSPGVATRVEYPAYEARDVVLRTGATIRVRPIAPGDEPALAAFTGRLSSATLSTLFFPLADALDYEDRFAVLGETGGRVVGAGQYERDRKRPGVARLAVVVEDALHGNGIGTHLLERLAEIGRGRGIAVFETHVSPHNKAIVGAFRNCGFGVDVTFEDGVEKLVVRLAETPLHDEKSARRAEIAAAASMTRVLAPRSVAVVGASREPGKIGAHVLHNLIATGFRGEVFPINPSAGEIEGKKAYARVSDVPFEVDLAVICVPAKAVEAAVDDCIARGVAGLVVITAGFGETGEEGRRREAAILEKVRRAGMRMVGPNCLGVVNTDPAVRLNVTFSPVYPPEGNLAISSQSGALGMALLEHASRLNLGISSFVSVGNKADVSGNDLIQYWAEDPRTSVILLYLESFGNPARFSRIARRVGRKKPIIAVKAGRSAAGARAAASHTGALAASDAVVDALFRQSGVIRTRTLEELFDVSALLAHQPVPRGNRVAIVTNAGGPGILAADVCEAQGLTLPSLSPDTAKELRSILPPAASVANPVDMLAAATPELYEKCLRLVLADENVDSVLVIFIPPVATDPEAVARAIVAAGRTAAEKKTMLGIFMSVQGAPAILAPIPSYPFPESAAQALARAVEYGKWREEDDGLVPVFPDARPDAAREVVAGALARGGGWLTPPEAERVLAAFGIPCAPQRLAADAAGAVAAARELGYPVAMKAVGPDIVHKTEVHGVRLGLKHDEDVEAALADLRSRLGPRLTGVLVQPMVTGGVEVIAGTTQDPTFGPLVLYGSGGILVDLLQDVTFRLSPLTDVDAARMLEDVRGKALLRGYRGAPPMDEGALRELLLRVSALSEACPEIREMDLNPVTVLARGVRVLDARIRVGRPPRLPASRRIAY